MAVFLGGRTRYGFTATRIRLEPQAHHGFADSDRLVWRIVLRLGWKKPLPFRWMDCEICEVAQFDFGTGVSEVDERGTRWHELRITLMTLDRSPEDWGKLTGDVPAATAILDRFHQDAN